MEDALLTRGKRESKPLLLKLGFALVLSLAGYFVSHLRSRPRLPPPSSSSGDGSKKNATKSSSIATQRGLKDELRILTSEEAFCKIINGTTTKATSSEEGSGGSGQDEAMIFLIEEAVGKTISRTPNTCTIAATDSEEGFLLPEFEQVVMRELEENPEKTAISSPMGESLEIEEEIAKEEEITYLRNLVQILRERERSFEVQMIEYHGLKEQEAALRELENRVKVNTTESKLLSLKIESLEKDNQRLREQVSDYPVIVSELELAREKIALLKKSSKLEEGQANERLAALRKRIAELMHRERQHGEDDAEVEKKLKRLKELEGEVMDLKKKNSRLEEENSELAKALEDVKISASSACKGLEVELLERASQLRDENENLKKEMEQLQTDRCADVEELVYLRWVNACLRYELRNYQPSSGKTVARDLSNRLSPKSEEKAKQLILEYAHSGANEGNMRLLDFDSESCSSSQTSSGEYSDLSIDIFSSTKNSSSSKSKFFGKLKKLVLGKDRHRNQVGSTEITPTSCGNSTRRASISPYSFEDIIGRRSSFDSISSCISVEESHAKEQWQNKVSQAKCPSRCSLDAQRLRRLDADEVKDSISERCKSDLATSYSHKRMISADECFSGMNHDQKDTNDPEKIKLRKFAEVLKGSHGSLKLKKRLAPHRS